MRMLESLHRLTNMKRITKIDILNQFLLSCPDPLRITEFDALIHNPYISIHYLRSFKIVYTPNGVKTLMNRSKKNKTPFLQLH